jgi:hypothetical protein
MLYKLLQSCTKDELFLSFLFETILFLFLNDNTIQK